MTALRRRLDHETEDRLSRRMHFQTTWDPYLRQTMIVLELYHDGTEHYQHHRRQLTLRDGDFWPKFRLQQPAPAPGLGFDGKGRMTMRTSTSDKWVRAFVGDIAVVDSRTPLLVWEPELPEPRYVFGWEDVRRDLLRPATGEPPEQPWFFLPHHPVAEWFDIVSDGRVLHHAAWTYADPDLADRVAFSWQPDLLDRWLEEDEEVAGHPRDPYKRVEAIASSRRVSVTLNGVPLADSHDPVLLFETDLPTRYYLPESDVDLAQLTPSSNRSHCPYKGVANRYWDVGDRLDGRNLAWSYSDPFPAVAKVAGRVAFYNECVDITVDGVAVPRPVSPFSKPAQRPGS